MADLRLSKPPKFLYKYTSKAGVLSILSKRSIKVTPPNQLNDSRELLADIVDPHIDERLSEAVLITKDHWAAALRNKGLEAFPDLMRDLEVLRATVNMPESAPLWRGLLGYVKLMMSNEQALHDGLTELLAPHSDFRRSEVPDVMSKAVQDSFSKILGIFSLSSVRLNEVMWGNYAESQSGGVVGFDTTHKHFKSYPAHRVIYSNEVPRFVFGEVSAFVAAATTKRRIWRYEKEWRQIVDLRDCGLVPERGIYLLSIDPRLIRNLILGPRSDKAFESQVRELLGQKHWSHVALLKVHQTKSAWATRPAETA